MSVPRTPPARAATAAVAVLAALLLTGCPWWSNVQPPDLSAEQRPVLDPPADKAAAKDAGLRGAAADAQSSLSTEGWIRTVAAPDDSAPPKFRWRNPAVEDLLDDEKDPRAALHAVVKGSDRIQAANAAIALGRMGDASVTGRLVDVVNDHRLKLPTRCAAAEALGRMADPAAVEQLRKLIDRYQYDPKKRHRYVAEIHAELVRGLARHLDAEDHQRLVAALRSPSAAVQLEALAALEDPRAGELPEEAADLRSCHDPRVRGAALRLLALRRHPHAEEYLARALDDFDVSVREAAIAGLGILGGEKSREKLKKLTGDRAELVRAAVVTAMADAGDRQGVFQLAGDKSWRVRLEVAKELSRYPDARGESLARRLLDDPSTSIGPQVLKSVAKWPLPLAGPILLEAMGKESYMVRKTGSEQLALRWPPAAEFSYEAPPERRREILGKLLVRFHSEVGRPAGALAGPTPGKARAAAKLTPEQLDDVARLLKTLADGAAQPADHQAAVARLIEMGPGLVEALEQLGPKRDRPLPEAVYREVLPHCSPTFEVLDRMASADVNVRRRAAGELVEIAAQKPLPLLAVGRLADLVASEEDQLVWRSVLLAVAADGREPSIRLAYSAISHPSPEVRRRACEHLAAHPDASHARVLLPALQDPCEPVVLAAIRALGAADRLDHPEAMERLLGSGNLNVQFEAARVLARFGAPSGTMALERLALCGDPSIRREVAEAMGEIADPAATDTLIRLLDDGHGIRRAALASLAKVAGHDAGAPRDDSLSIMEQVDAWKRWYEHRRSTIGRREQPERVE